MVPTKIFLLKNIHKIADDNISTILSITDKNIPWLKSPPNWAIIKPENISFIPRFPGVMEKIPLLNGSDY